MENIIKKLEYIQEKDFIDEIQNALDNETDINNCKFINEDIKKENIINVEFKNCIFKSCKIEGNFEKSYFTFVIFEDCDFSNSSFCEANFNNVICNNCKFIGANFIESRIYETKIENSNFSYSNFGLSILRQVNINDTILDNSNFSKVKFLKIEFNNVSLIRCEFTESNLENIDFRKCDISGWIVKINDLKGAIFNELQAIELSKIIGIIVK